MAKVIPFKGIRPTVEKCSKIAALPYDVYNREEAKEVVTAQTRAVESIMPIIVTMVRVLFFLSD